MNTPRPATGETIEEAAANFFAPLVRERVIQDARAALEANPKRKEYSTSYRGRAVETKHNGKGWICFVDGEVLVRKFSPGARLYVAADKAIEACTNDVDAHARYLEQCKALDEIERRIQGAPETNPDACELCNSGKIEARITLSMQVEHADDFDQDRTLSFPTYEICTECLKKPDALRAVLELCEDLADPR